MIESSYNRRGRSNKRNRKKIASVHKQRSQIKDVYQKAVQEYEEYKRISKNNLQASVHNSEKSEAFSSSMKGDKDDSRRVIGAKALNQAGRSVLTYKKLVNNIKSPYLNQVVVDNLQKAYHPGKIRRRNMKKKKKSSTPNMKFRKYHQKNLAPVLKNSKNLDSRDQLEIDQLRAKILENNETCPNVPETMAQPSDPTKNCNEVTMEDLKEVSEVAEEINESDDEKALKVEDVTNQGSKEEIRQVEEVEEENKEEEKEENKDGKEENKDEKEENKEEPSALSIIAPNTSPPKILASNTPQKSSNKKKKKEKPLPKTIKRVFPNCTDTGLWRKRNRLTHKTKVFKMFGNYTTIKQCLYERGWVENKDKTSPCFDLLWTLRQRDIDYETLKDGQMVNHFRYNGAITTKVGLCRNISKVINFNNVDIDSFFPKCYALKDEGEWDDFCTDFKVIRAEGVLKSFMKGEEVAQEKLKAAMTVCLRSLLSLDDIIDKPFKHMVTENEWDLLKKGTKKKGLKNKGRKFNSLAPVRKTKAQQSPQHMKNLNSKRDTNYKSPSIVTLKLPEIEKKSLHSTVKEKEGFFVDQHIKEDVLKSMVETQGPKVEPEAVILSERNINSKESIERPLSNPQKRMLGDVKGILERMEKKFPQYHINGDKNIWIAKPAGLSRGRGIQVFSSLDDISAYTRGKEKNWIIQKYIENPLIINNRKFDLRVWVLVTCLNPLTIWFWDKPYVRFPAADYTDENLDDRFIHLTNNSVAKNAKHLEIVGDGNMWFIEQLEEYLRTKYGRDVWNDELKKKIKNIIIYSLQSVQDTMDTKKGSFEMLGYDIMIDDKFNPWLIEVNSSPTMEFSTGVTKTLATNVMESVVKVISDYCMAPKNAKKKDIDTGDFSLIYKGKKYNEKGLNLFGLNFCCEGTRIYY